MSLALYGPEVLYHPVSAEQTGRVGLGSRRSHSLALWRGHPQKWPGRIRLARARRVAAHRFTDTRSRGQLPVAAGEPLPLHDSF